ncbi:MAG: ArsA-related P-loop ATPase, partial [Candidatus Thermoplasmatota archaeon]|nr:ArsA-related P-loop ATPase [Candidatus Thermoplasmatota archaeon]
MIYIFIGKGGVGKSTLACALALSREKVKLFSADPMSNLRDILGEDTGIDMEELNVDKAVEEYLKKSVKEVKKAYNYLSALNLDSLVNAIEFTPGIEEHVMLA